MKKSILKTVFALVLFLGMNTNAFSQSEPPTFPGHGNDENAPIGTGMAILLAFGAGYGAKKVYDARKQE